MIRVSLTFAIAALGAALFHGLGLPLPFLFGPMAACLVGALCGMRLRSVRPLSIAARATLGVAIGASITPALLGQIPQMALTVALIPIYVVVIALIGVPFFRRICGFDQPTAYYCAMPGGLQDMVIFGEEAGADVRALSLVHATRVLVIVAVAPVLMTSVYDATLDGAIGTPAVMMDRSEIVWMIVAALVGWRAGKAIGLFGAAILGPMIVTAGLSLGDVIHFRPPAEAMLGAQFLIGTGIGVHYVGVTAAELRRDVIAAAAFMLILAALAAGVTAGVTAAGLAPPLEVFLAFAPGGQAEMALLAIAAGADLGFVVVHHIARLVVVIAGAPLLGRVLDVTRR